MTIAVKLGMGPLISPQFVRLVVHGLPARLCREGMGQTILTAAGFSTAEYTRGGGRIPWRSPSQILWVPGSC